jgi:hypothetical protein
VRCSQLHGAQVVLVGDAAHAVTPVGGQGANAALQDCEVLDHMLEEYGMAPPGAECCRSRPWLEAEKRANVPFLPVRSYFRYTVHRLACCVHAYTQTLLPWTAQVSTCVTCCLLATVPIQQAAGTGLGRVCAGSDMAAAAERWTAVRGPDAQALADIEASFYKLVGGRKLGFLDPGFLRLIAHIALGAPARTHDRQQRHQVCGQAEGVNATVRCFACVQYRQSWRGDSLTGVLGSAGSAASAMVHAISVEQAALCLRGAQCCCCRKLGRSH